MAGERDKKRAVDLTVEAVVRCYVANRGVILDTAAELGVNRRTVRSRLRTEEGQQRLAEYAGEVLEQYHVSAERVVGEAAALAFSDLPRILRSAGTVESLNALEPHHRAAVAQVEVGDDGRITKLRLHSKLDALKLLAVYAEIAGLGAAPPGLEDGTTSGRGELGGLHISGPTTEANDAPRAIPRPERLD